MDEILKPIEEVKPDAKPEQIVVNEPAINIKSNKGFWIYSAVVTAAVVFCVIFGFKKSAPVEVPHNFYFTNNTVSSVNPKPVTIPALAKSTLILKTNANGSFDTNVLVVLDVNQYSELLKQISDVSNYYVRHITAKIVTNYLVLDHYLNSDSYALPDSLKDMINYTKRYNVASLGYSVCGRVFGSYERLDIVDFDKFGFGFSSWGTFNTVEPGRRLDVAIGVNGNW